MSDDEGEIRGGDEFDEGSGGPPEEKDITREPTAPRDCLAEVQALIDGLGPNDTLTLAQIRDELNTDQAKAHLAEGVIATAVTSLTDDGAIKAVPLGDPLVIHYMRMQRKDDDLRRPICMEVAGLPATDEPQGMAAQQVVDALSERFEAPFTAEQVQPNLDELVQKGILVTREIDVPMEVPPDAPEGTEPGTAKVIFYDFAPGMLYAILADGLDARITPSAVAARQGAHAVKADRLGEDLESLRKKHEKLVADHAAALAKLADWRQRLEARGLPDIIAELEAPAPPVKDDSRGKPFLFRERLPITPDLGARFFEETKAHRGEIRRIEARLLTDKENYGASKKTNEARIGELNSQIDDLEVAYDGGYYLLSTQAYRSFNSETRQTEIRRWSDDSLIKIETKADIEANVPRGANLEIPTAVTPTPEAPKAEEQKPNSDKPKKPRGRRKGKKAE